MSGTPPSIEWYIARDNVQHGPVSDVEMRKLVELGHLRGTDLVWSPRFTAWQSAAQVFPELLKPAPPAPVPPPAAPPPAQMPQQPVPTTQSRPASAPGVAAMGPSAPSPAVAASPAGTPSQGLHAGHASQARQQPQSQAQLPRAAGPHTAPAGRSNENEAAWAEAMRGMLDGAQRPQAPASAAPRMAPAAAGPTAAAAQHPGVATLPQQPDPFHRPAQTAAGPRPVGTPLPAAPAPFAIAPGMHGAPAGLHPQPVLQEAPTRREPMRPEPDEGPGSKRRGRGWIGVATAAFAVVLILSGLGWFMWQNRALVTGAGATAISTVLSSTTRTNAPSSDHLRAAPYQALGETREQIDAALQRVAVWRYLKREFADWYGEIVAEIERRRGQKADERAITQFMVDVIVTLRRRNAQAALQSSPEHLKGMASAFVANLRQLGSRDGATCFAFVSHGESSPFMIELSRTAAFAETLQRQMIAVFEAVVDARAARKIHPNTRRADYDRLTQDLLARGWTQTDLATFSDPQKLSQSPPDKVCTLVQDWFSTQLALKEADLQTRLLAESLKPLVGG